MKPRFRFIGTDGYERSAADLAELADAIQAGTIGPDTMLYDAKSGRWEPARDHDVFAVLQRQGAEGLRQRWGPIRRNTFSEGHGEPAHGEQQRVQHPSAPPQERNWGNADENTDPQPQTAVLPSATTARSSDSATPRQVEAARHKSTEVPQVRPWVRLFARMVDGLLWGLILGFILLLVSPAFFEDDTYQFLFPVGASLLWVPVEALFLWRLGWTPGKLLLGTRVTTVPVAHFVHSLKGYTPPRTFK